MKSNFSRPIRFHSWTSSNWTQKKVAETKSFENPKRHPENGIFHPMISWVYNNHCVISIFHLVFLWANIKEKNLLNMYHGDCRISQSGRFWWPPFGSNFYTVNVIFGWNQLYQKIFYIFWEWDEQKILQLSLKVLIHERNAFTWPAIFFRAQLYLTKVSPTM